MLAHASVATDLMVPSLRALSRLGPDIERRAQESGLAILRRDGLAIDSFANLSERIPHVTAVALLENAVRVSGDPAFALRAGHAIERGDLGLFDLLARSAPTLGSSMSLAAHYLPLVHDGAAIESTEDSNEAVWRHRLSPSLPPSAAVNEYVVATFFFSARQMLGFEAPPIEIWMTHDAPSHHAVYVQLFGAPVRFGRECNAIVLRREALALPLASADPVLLPVLTRYADELLARVPHAEPFVRRVREEMIKRLDRGASLTSIARALRMSESSVQRRLQAAGTSHTDLVDQLRRERALALLSNLELNISEVAFQLGFAHPPAFHRAFKRWYGHSPTEHRARALRSDFYRFYRGNDGSGSR